MYFCSNIRYLRKQFGYSQDALAEILGYKSYTTIQKWETGVSDPPLKIVHELSTLFHIDVDSLMTVDLENGQTSTGPSLKIENRPASTAQQLISLISQLPPDRQALLLSWLQTTMHREDLELIDLYLNLPEEQKAQAISYIRFLAGKEYQLAAARGNSQIRIPVIDPADLPEEESDEL